MLYDFHRNCEYSFNFRPVGELVLQDEYFNGQNKYINKWLSIFDSLERSDKAERNSLIQKIDGGEFFQFKLDFDNQTFFLHFNIETIKSDILNNPLYYTLQSIPINYFGTTSGSQTAEILYTKELNKGHDRKTPIIICPLLVNDAEYVVIDGNHRVSQMVNNNAAKIDVVAYKPQTEKCFLSKVDWAMYLFKAEISQICMDHQRYRKSINSLIRKSHAFTTFQNI